MMTTIHGVVNVEAVGPGFTNDPGDPKSGKPYLRLIFPGGPTVCLTANVAELIGGVGRGATARWQDLQREQGGSER